MTSPWVIAHRGGPAAGVEENSLAAFAAAQAAGADMMELDVRRSGDGKLVVVHDTAVAGLSVRRTPLAALRAATGLELAELSTVVDFAAGRFGLDVELKESGYEEEVLARRRDHLICRLSEVREIMRPVAVPGETVRYGLCDGLHRQAHELVPA